ncbi:MAG: hypothetical protein QM535_15045 [Limnohabitans sp.]|nr:hypothetical protein [Limnohabitans sp.]
MIFITIFIFIFIIWVSFSFSTLVNEQIDYRKFSSIIDNLIEKKTSNEKITTIFNEVFKGKKVLSMISEVIDKTNDKDQTLYPPCQQLTTTLIRDLAKNDKDFISSMGQLITVTILENIETIEAIKSIIYGEVTGQKIESFVKESIGKEIDTQLITIVSDQLNQFDLKMKKLDIYMKEFENIIKLSVLIEEKIINKLDKSFFPSAGTLLDRQNKMILSFR